MTSEEVIAKATEFDKRLEGLEARLDLAKQFTNLKQDDIVGLIKYSAETFSLGISVLSDMQVDIHKSIETNAKNQLLLAQELADIKNAINDAQSGGEDPEGGSNVRSGDEWKPPGWTPSFADKIRDLGN